jgi:hypothetical protein
MVETIRARVIQFRECVVVPSRQPRRQSFMITHAHRRLL